MFEYMQLISSGDNPLSFEFVSRIALLIFFGLILATAGFKIKGTWGSAIAIVFGTVFFLYNQGVLKF
jgi:hypothetical protein